MRKFLNFCCFIVVILICGGVFGYLFVLPDVLPQDYSVYVKKYSKEYGLDEDLVYSVIFNESRFEENAVSSAGAIGLMQVTPETGEWIKGHMGIEDAIDLNDPETNISMGCWYLDWLGEKFNDNEKTMLAGYNAGHNRVSQWLVDEEYSKNGDDLIYIPYPETSAYVEKVAFVKELYDFFY